MSDGSIKVPWGDGKEGANVKTGGEGGLLCLVLGSLVFHDVRQATGWVSTCPSRHFQLPARQRAEALGMGCELGTGWVSRALSLGEKRRGWEVPWPADAGGVGARGLGSGASAGTRVQDGGQVGGLGPRGKGAPGKQQARSAPAGCLCV